MATVDVKVTNPNEQSVTLTDGFEYVAGTDPHWDDVALLVDASDKGEGTDPHWDDVALLIDASKRT